MDAPPDDSSAGIAPDPGRVVSALLAWFAAHARRLPWRDDPTPYNVLLSELMLQQTRVATVLPYFAAFKERWPTLADLAAASEEEVLHAWSGLGYYSRARNLHRCAKEAVASGGLPADVDALRQLPGIGPYTAGAIASIAHDEPAPLVDGNVERVLSRIDARTADPRSTAGRKALWGRAQALHDANAGHPGALNQALMELGATVCLPRRPRCGDCPVGELCVGRARSLHLELPRKAPKKPPTPMFAVCGLLRVDGALVLAQRPKTGLLAGLWEPVLAEIDPDTEPEAALIEAFRELAGVRARVRSYLGEVVHVFTHRRLTCAVYALEPLGDASLRVGGRYQRVAAVADPETVPLSALARRIVALDRQPTLFAADGPAR